MPPPTQQDWVIHDKPSFFCTFFQNVWVRFILAFAYFGINIVILVFALIPPYVDADGTKRSVRGWVYPAVIGGILIFGILYYFAVIPNPMPASKWRWTQFIEESSLISITGAKAHIKNNLGANQEVAYDRTYGFKRTLEVKFPEDEVSIFQGDSKRHN